MEKKSCCFIGHRKVQDKEPVFSAVKKVIETLITEQDVRVFYFGSRSEFDDLALKAVTELKETYQDIKRVYVRSAFAHISESYTKYLLESYEETYMPEGVEKAGKASYVERNQAMIDTSDICVFYYNESYAPPRRKNSKRDLTDYQPKSGTKIAYDYAVRKKKDIINITERL